MKIHRRLTTSLAIALVAAGCGGAVSDVASGPPATSGVVDSQPAADPPGDTAPTPGAAPATVATTMPPADDDTQVVDLTDLASAVPADPCSLLTADDVARLVPGAGPGIRADMPPGSPAGGCNWEAASGYELELIIFDMMGQDVATIDPDALAAERFADTAATVEPIDVGVAGWAGAVDEDLVAMFLLPNVMYQVRVWSVGTAEPPASLWPAIRPELVAVAQLLADRAEG